MANDEIRMTNTEGESPGFRYSDFVIQGRRADITVTDDPPAPTLYHVGRP